MNIKLKTLLFFSLLLLISSCTNESKEGTSSSEPKVEINSLTDVVENLQPELETFTINPKEESVIRGKKGTVIYVPVDAFQFEDGTIPEGDVRIELKECYSLSDMIGENLNTVSGHRILETGGMINITATSEGKILEVKDGKAFVVGFPKNGENKEMGLFYQTAINDTFSTWVPDYEIYKEEDQIKTANDSKLSEAIDINYPFDLNDELYRNKLYIYSWSIELADVLVKGTQLSAYEYVKKEFIEKVDSKSVNNFASKYNDGVSSYINFDFYLNKDGKVYKFKEDSPKDTSSPLSKKFKDFLLSMPPLDFSSYNKEFRFDRYYAFGLNVAKELDKEKYRQRFRERYSNELKGAVKKIDKEAMQLYLFSSTKLGWINCDRFYDVEEEEKTNFYVEVPSPENSQVQIVFKDINSIMQGELKDGKFMFKNIPIGREIKIIAISHSEGQSTLGIEETKVSKKGSKISAFKGFSLDQLEAEING